MAYKILERRKLFSKLLPPLNGKDNRNDIKDLMNTCPSCGYPTLASRCSFETCFICQWEDDGQDDDDLLNEIKNNLLLLDKIENNLEANKNINDFIIQLNKLKPLFEKYRIMN